MATDDIFGPSGSDEKGIGSEIGSLFKSIKNILITKFKINLLILIILIAISVSAVMIMKKPAVIGAAVANVECPKNNTICPECAVCPTPTCEELNCSAKTEEVNKLFYVCDGGAIVNKSEDCKAVVPAITSKYVETANDITLSVDDWVITMENGSAGRIKTLDYTIINNGSKKIEPRIKIYFYEGSWADADWDTNFGFYTDRVLGEGDWIRETRKLNLYFNMENPKVRFELYDEIGHDSLLAVVKQIDTD